MNIVGQMIDKKEIKASLRYFGKILNTHADSDIWNIKMIKDIEMFIKKNSLDVSEWNILQIPYEDEELAVICLENNKIEKRLTLYYYKNGTIVPVYTQFSNDKKAFFDIKCYSMQEAIEKDFINKEYRDKEYSCKTFISEE